MQCRLQTRCACPRLPFQPRSGSLHVPFMVRILHGLKPGQGRVRVLNWLCGCRHLHQGHRIRLNFTRIRESIAACGGPSLKKRRA